MKDVRVAAVCMKSLPGEIDKNLERIRSFICQASDKRAAIICFPELSITGYILEKPEAGCSPALFEEASQQVLEMAGTNGVLVMAGIIEAMKDGGKPYITQILVGPGGLLGRYRKTHLSPPEQEAYRPGEEIPVYQCSHFTFGIQLCYESHFPEISTLMSLKGAEAIFMPHASPRGEPEEKLESWLRHLPSRAFDNGLYLVACNQVGQGSEGLFFPGTILALSPSGRIMERYCGTEDKMVLVDMKASEIEEVRSHRMKYFLPHRRPELYQDLLSRPRNTSA
jgi:predicted amidohydrolase